MINDFYPIIPIYEEKYSQKYSQRWEKFQAEYSQLNNIQLSKIIRIEKDKISRFIVDIFLFKKKRKKKKRLGNESLYRRQREFHSFPVDKFSSTWFISYENDDDVNVCGYRSRGCRSFPTTLRLQVLYRDRASLDLVVFYSATLFHGSCHSFTFPLAGAQHLARLRLFLYIVPPTVDSYLISNSSPPFRILLARTTELCNDSALPSMYRLVVLSFLPPPYFIISLLPSASYVDFISA